MLKRWHILAGAVLVVLVPAVGLRIHRLTHRPMVSLRSQPTSAPSLPSLPRDYVAEPMVDPAERELGPMRLISLAPSITEVVHALGLGSRMVGRTPYCLWPPGVETVPAVGALTDPNYELIRSLRPGLVLITSNSVQVAAGLERLGLTYCTVPHDTLDDVFRAIEVVGRTCERPRSAESLNAAIRADLETMRQWAASWQGRRWRVLVALGELPVPPRSVWAAGPGSFLDDLLRMAGQANAAREVLKVSHGEIPLTTLQMLDPEVIIEFGKPRSDETLRELYRSWPDVGRLQAIEQQRVRRVGDEQWLSAGPRIAITLHRLITALAVADPRE
ncbi:MAG TPA: helical backbone metal receptor [Phycisphaerae bacterium]|nr:helical backbone metal receptor [Phycisphaerae bacterium]